MNYLQKIKSHLIALSFLIISFSINQLEKIKESTNSQSEGQDIDWEHDDDWLGI